jgi:hypothetical protein
MPGFFAVLLLFGGEVSGDRRWVASCDSRHLLTFTGANPTSMIPSNWRRTPVSTVLPS